MVTFELDPAPPQTHKTTGIKKIEWARLFTGIEPFRIDELSDKINDESFEITGGSVSLSDDIKLVYGSVSNIGITYRDFLRTCFKRFNDTPSINVDDELIAPSLYAFELLGLLAIGRKEVIMQGVPL